MFTGIILAVGKVERLEPRGGDLRLSVATGSLPMKDAQIGDSIAVNGVCLTAIALTPGSFQADVSRETLSGTTLRGIKVGERVNLEPALTPTTRLGGHLVSGHVDGVGRILERRPDGRSARLVIETPASLARYVATKGSICVDGISLTVNHVDGARFGVNIVPHTLAETTLGDARPGQEVNLEVDLIARYLERLLLGERAAEGSGAGGGIDLALLSGSGFLDGAAHA